MPLRKFHCLNCEKDFEEGAWTCADGQSNHVVEQKTYRSLDAPTAPGKQAEGTLPPVVRGRTLVCNIPPPKKVMKGDEVSWVGEGNVEFINGIFMTSDPEKQYWLDKKPGYQASVEQWNSIWKTKDEQLEDKRLELAAMQSRIESERNELLAMTKQQKRA